jgi:hypothetical protein
MSQYHEPQVPWGFVGPFLADAKKRVEAGLIATPGAKLSGIEITLYQKRGTEAPTEEYNLTLGKIGERFVPDSQIDEKDEDQQQSFRLDNRKGTFAQRSFLDWLIAILRMIWIWLLRLLGIRKKDDSTEVPLDSSDSTSANDPVEKMLADIRTELAIRPELEGFAVGVRALIERSPACIIGLRCEWNWSRLGWYYRRYYEATTFLGGTTCSRSWTSTPC